MRRQGLIKQRLRTIAGVLISTMLTTGVLYVGVPVSAEDVSDQSSTGDIEVEIGLPEEETAVPVVIEDPEDASAQEVAPGDYDTAVDNQTDTYATEEQDPSEPTGWIEEVESVEVPSDVAPELSFVQADLTEEGVYNALISMRSVYPEGMTYTNADSYSPYYHYDNGRRITYTGYGCAGFAFHLSNVAFGDLPDREHRNWDEIRVGDILRINNDQHSVIVLDVNGNNITVAEGNYNSSIHWGRVLNRSDLKNGKGTYIWTRWPEGTPVNNTVSSITLSKTSINDVDGNLYTLTAKVSPSSALDTSVTWSTSNSNVAYIYAKSDNVAYIYLSNPGTCTITCTSNQNPAVKASCTVRVADLEKLEAFSTRLYEKCLGRAPDASGLEHWIEVLATGERTGADVAKGFVFSTEYTMKNTSDDAFVEMLYNVFMDRGSDAGGKAHWMNYLSQGLSREFVFRGFAQSAEYSAICESYGITRGSVTLTQPRDQNPQLTMYVSRLYTQALGRAYDVDGLNHWCKTIQAGVKNPQQVAESFINSKEFQNKNLNNTEYIKVLYRTFMGREYDQAGLEHWISEMNKGCSRQNILSRFAGSKEFRNIQATFGL